MTIEKLPKFELYEEGGQIRKSSKSVKSTIDRGHRPVTRNQKPVASGQKQFIQKCCFKKEIQ
jgi:hypothetical protein